MAELAADVLVGAVLVACAYAAGARTSRRSGPVWLVALLVAAEAVVGVPGDASVPVFLACLVPWAVGRELAARRDLAAALAERNRQLEAEEEALARLAVRRERTRIARELHDIVAHNLAVIVVQAGAGRMAKRWEPAVAAGRLAAIRESGHQVLLEMSRLTDVLGADGGDDPDERLRALLDGARAAGLTVRAEPWPPLLHALAETALRVVQEAVTNAIKHAPGARLDVGLALRDDALRIEVRDTGAEAASDLAATGSGSGLDGMRARVGAHGGRLDAGPEPHGGWRVVAELPAGVTPRG